MKKSTVEAFNTVHLRITRQNERIRTLRQYVVTLEEQVRTLENPPQETDIEPPRVLNCHARIRITNGHGTNDLVSCDQTEIGHQVHTGHSNAGVPIAWWEF
jgi:hypothetical protein